MMWDPRKHGLSSVCVDASEEAPLWSLYLVGEKEVEGDSRDGDPPLPCEDEFGLLDSGEAFQEDEQLWARFGGVEGWLSSRD